MAKQSKNLNDHYEIDTLKSLVFDTPEAQHTKINLIKEEIKLNRHRINHQHIAEKILEHAPLAAEVEIA